ncbi:MAG: hypothetical protein PUC97_01860, partial [bacterium]|nr:hypothetical protein [bacterium]
QDQALRLARRPKNAPFILHAVMLPPILFSILSHVAGAAQLFFPRKMMYSIDIEWMKWKAARPARSVFYALGGKP